MLSFVEPHFNWASIDESRGIETEYPVNGSKKVGVATHIRQIDLKKKYGR